MLSNKSIQTIQYLKSLCGDMPLYSRYDNVSRTLPCIVYSSSMACILDFKNKRRYECAYVTNSQTVVYTDGGYKPEKGYGIIGAWYSHSDSRNFSNITFKCKSALEAEIEA